MTIRSHFPHTDKQTTDSLGLILEEIQSQSQPWIERSGRPDKMQAALERMLHHISITRNIETARAIYRYLLEGERNTYVPDASLFDHVHTFAGSPHASSLLDLGAGPGSIVRRWSEEVGPARGIDVSPSFVSQNSHLRLGMIDADQPQLVGIKREKQFDVVLSSLTLDRVARPRQLIRNMQQHTGNGIAVLITLLPVVPVDDEAVQHPIVYTPPEQRIANTGTVEGDCVEVRRVLEDVFQRPVGVHQLETQVRTVNGTQTYPDTYAFVVSPDQSE